MVCFMMVLAAFGASADINDPFERVNRSTQGFNDFADRHFMRPIADGYGRVLPGPVYRSLGRVYSNFEDVGDAVNNLLQGKPGAFISDLLRVSINSTIGLGGFFDPASRLGLPDHDEDFAQTLATWHVPRGPYVVIPFLGPSSLRDVFARSIGGRMDPVIYLDLVSHRNTTYAMRLVHQRADLLTADSVIFGDRYIFFRDAFVQRREFLENDGEIDDDPFEDDF